MPVNLMRAIWPCLAVWLIAAFLPVQGAEVLAPVPEAQQAALARKILDGYGGGQPAAPAPKLHVAYFTPSDREPEPRYRERLQAIMEDIQSFYRDGMAGAGYGPETFDLARDQDGRLIIHLVKSAEPEAKFKRSASQEGSGDAWSRATITREIRAGLQADGLALDRETVLIFCNLAKWDAAGRRFSHHSPYLGDWTQTNGYCFAVDSVILNAQDLGKKEPVLHDAEWGEESLGKFNTVFIGGIAHELGHAFTLPHCGARLDERARGVSLMGAGNHMYREELRGEGPGAFLTMASAMKLAGRPLFNRLNANPAISPKLIQNELSFSTNLARADWRGRPNALRLEGRAAGTPPVYGVIAYFDSSRAGGYDTPAVTAVPDADGRFAMEIGDLAPTRHGELHVQYCFANGAALDREMTFKVLSEREANSELAQTESALQPLIHAVRRNDARAARQEADQLGKSRAPALARRIAGKLAATLAGGPQFTPAGAPPDLKELALGDAKETSAAVGWFKPSANRMPANDEVPSPLLDCGTFYATGLFAHAPSRYVFALGGKWKTLRGEGGLHTLQQPYGSVDFVIQGDGRELFHSPVIRGAAKAAYQVDVSGVQTLELIVGDGGNGNGNDWALWLDPVLTR